MSTGEDQLKSAHQPDNLLGVRVLAVMNPRATAASPHVRDALLRPLQRMAHIEIAHTTDRGHAQDLACQAMRAGTDVLIAVGGDGTVNEIVNGLLADGPGEHVPALGVVPLGSTNVFARALGLSNAPAKATDVLRRALRTGSYREVSLGRVDDRWFVFATGIGLDGAIVHGVEQRRAMGKRSTHVLYTRVGLRAFFQQTDRKHPHLYVELPDGTVLEDIFMSVVTNTDPWTFVGKVPLRPTPRCSFDDGLAMYARRTMSFPASLYDFARMAGSPATGSNRTAQVAYDLPSLVIRADEPTPVQIDGDYLGERDKLVFTHTPRAIRILL